MAENARFQSGTLPDSFVGADNHGPDLVTRAPGTRVRTRTMASIAWGGANREVTSEHGQPCDYCAVAWPTGVGMPAHTHPGVDISMVRGTPLYATAAGTVTFAGWSPRFYRPNQVQITTPDGQLHIYAHMWSVSSDLVAGAVVKRGDYLGTSGEQTFENTMTPDGTGGHLHFEVRRTADGVAIDPEPILTTDIPHDVILHTIGRPPVVAPGDRLIVFGDGLRLRDGPGTTAAILRVLEAGSSLMVLGEPDPEEGYTWARVRTTDGAAGFVALEFCAPDPDSPEGFSPGDRIETVDHAVRFRSAPGTSATILREFALGDVACVTGFPIKANGFVWYPIRVPSGKDGWIAGEFCGLLQTGGCLTDPPVVSDRENWPTATAIEDRIRLSNHVNGRISKLTGLGKAFVALGERFGINPAIAVAIAQRECQMGADGSHLPEHLNNFGGITAGANAEYPGPCGSAFFGDRHWQVFCSAEDGVEGIFALLDTPLYRATGGRFETVMRHYSPEFENPWDGPGSIWEVFHTVGEQIGVTISRDTNIYR